MTIVDSVAGVAVGTAAAAGTTSAAGAADAAGAQRIVYLDGRYLPSGEAAISVDDRGFLFGDGVYEVTRFVNGRPLEPDRHRRRMERGLRELAIPLPATGLEELDHVAMRLVRENGLGAGNAMVYVQVTRGAAFPRTHQFPTTPTAPTVYLSASAIPFKDELRARGVSAITVPDIRWARCDLKTVNLLPNALARQKAAAVGAYEGIFVRDGVLLEGSQTNVFAVIDGELRTAPRTNYILPGVTREVVLELALGAGMHVREYPIQLDELASATELFLTSTTSDVMPVVRLDGDTMGAGEPGPVARRLQEVYAALL